MSDGSKSSSDERCLLLAEKLVEEMGWSDFVVMGCVKDSTPVVVSTYVRSSGFALGVMVETLLRRAGVELDRAQAAKSASLKSELEKAAEAGNA